LHFYYVKMRKYLSSLFLIFSFSCNTPLNQPEEQILAAQEAGYKPGLSTWITDNADFLANKPINKLVYPSSHDSATFGINDQSVVCTPYQDPKSSDYPQAEAIRLEKFTGGAPIGALWSITQPEDLVTQLSYGVRGFDFRICEMSNGDLYTEHTMVGSPAIPLLRTIAAFALTHPKEIIFISLGWRGVPNDENKRIDIYNRLIEPLFGNRIATKEELGPTSTLQEFWDKQKNVVITSWDVGKTRTGWPGSYFWGSRIEAPSSAYWGDPDTILADAEQRANDSSRDYNKMFRTGATFGLDVDEAGTFILDILSGRLTFFDGILPQSDRVNSALLNKLKSGWLKGKLNSVGIDNAGYYDLTNWIIKQNF